jgi:hypothetical protein
MAKSEAAVSEGDASALRSTGGPAQAASATVNPTTQLDAQVLRVLPIAAPE